MLDHLVYAGPDLADAVARVAALTGVTPAPGGRHVGLGTANHLADLGAGAYLEVIGPDPAQPDPEGPRPFGIDDLTEPALVAWAVRAPDLDATIARARAHGFDPGDAIEMSRESATGELLRWRLTPPSAPGSLRPFLIDWGTTPHPTTRDLPSIPLLMLTGTHPDPASVQVATDALGLELLVRRAGKASLTAALRSRDGRQVALT
ncbi:VOC family protein [Amycolatopsis australiensis]|uniref:Glyoxalase-like domain-containing protein n=1 Tax=Amycolatopsis australiensis TaxID=546364 RepID=A0A1K1T760_9PSEU|nr:VOC family protein [Amycolatopsis australiensis]SFW92410.1 Glyoxalase-like domain-containing protein [Amycolatopsis australiensis]